MIITIQGKENFSVYYENFNFTGRKEDLIKICEHMNNEKSEECINQLKSGKKTGVCFGIFQHPFEGTQMESKIRWIEENLPNVKILRTVYQKS